MIFPRNLPGRRGATVIIAVYAIIWLALEGELWRDFLLSALLLVLILWHLGARYLAGRSLSLTRWLALAASAGFAYGVGLVLLTLFLMALKTGLHAHGPEYSPAEIAWVWTRLWKWGLAGLVAGLGMGLLIAGISPRH
jgi:hypothetical protein